MKQFRTRSFQLLMVVVATVLAYSNIFQNDFVIDDSVFITQWQEVHSLGSVASFFQGASPPGHEGVYRPVRNVLYSIYYQLFGTNPFGWHAQALVVHLLNTVLVYLIIARISHLGHLSHLGNLLPFAAALLFGLHPIHTESITYIASSMDAIGLTFFFAAFYLYLRRRLIVSSIFAVLAFFSNELTLTLPLLILLYEFSFRTLRKTQYARRSGSQTTRKSDTSGSLSFSESFRKALPYFAFVFLYLFIRFFALGITSRGPYLANSVYLTFLTMTRVFVKYMLLLLLPINQANNHAIGKGIEAFVYRDYRTEAIVAQRITDLHILISLMTIIAFIAIAIWLWRRHPLVTFSIGWFFISLLPVSEIIPQGSMMNERMLYMPSFGFTLLFVYLIFNFQFSIFNQFLKRLNIENSMKIKNLALVILVAIVATSYGFLTYQRNFDWKNEITLWSKDVAVYPSENAYAYYQLGNALVRAGKINEAIPMHERSNQINPKFVLGLGSIALLYSNAGMVDKAEEMYKKAILKNPTFWEGRFNLGNIYVQQGKLDLALEQYRAVVEINPNFAQARQSIDMIQYQKERGVK